MLRDYLPVLLQIIVAVGFAASALIVSVHLGKAGRRNRIKDSPYECGMVLVGVPQPRLSVTFYLIAMLFILFDLEIVFMYPWSAVSRELTHAHRGQRGVDDDERMAALRHNRLARLHESTPAHRFEHALALIHRALFRLDGQTGDILRDLDLRNVRRRDHYADQILGPHARF